ncbi:hypothetical protein ACWDRX_35065, partial [Streptomyces nigra]
SSLDRLRAEVERRNPAEPEFHQAAREVLETLRTAGQGDERAAVVPERPRIVDADAVRDELDAFEAAVERAHRESGAVPVPAPNSPTQNENDPPEGAEQ